MYRICFEGGNRGLDKYEQVWDSRKGVERNMTFWRELWNPKEVVKLRHRRQTYTEWLIETLGVALARGEDEDLREEASRIGLP
jgi:hypothetical protein